MRPFRPEPSEHVRIKKAMRAARFMKWGATPLGAVGIIAAIAIGVTTAWYFGVIAFLVIWCTLFIGGYSAARCPRCGQVWWSPLGMLLFMPWLIVIFIFAEHEDETESFVCRRCRLDIGMGLRK